MRFGYILMIATAVVLTVMSVRGAMIRDAAMAAKSGFVTPKPGLRPASFRPPAAPTRLSIPGPSRRTIIIYSPGAQSPGQIEHCTDDVYAPPPAVLALERTPGTHVYYLCPRSTDAGNPGSYIFGRAREIEAVVDIFLRRGVEPRNIFLAGHSAGAWSAMMLMNEAGRKFNAVIAFAPACCYPRAVAERYPYAYWRKVVRPFQKSIMTAARRFEALVFAYPDDPFNRPADLAFLTDTYPEGVWMFSQFCGEGHMTTLKDCREADTTRIIRHYIEQRKVQFSG